MFRENPLSTEPSSVRAAQNGLTEAKNELLEKSWAGTFRQEVLGRLDEKPFAALYSSQMSRPNVPVNLLIGWEIIKSAFGMSDRAMYERFIFDLQVRHALGVDKLSDDGFTLRTVYNFRQRLLTHHLETGVNLVELAFEQVTDEQMVVFQVNSQQLRTDSTQVASDIAHMGRLQLLIEVLVRTHRILTDSDRMRYAESFAPYIKGKARNYIYRLERSDYASTLDKIGQVIGHLVTELAPTYSEEKAYQLLCRVFREHFVRDDSISEDVARVHPKAPADLAANSLQSPDDPDATYRHKAGESYKGYVSNITETCDPKNIVNLIVKVQTEANHADDAEMLRQSMPNLIERTDVEVIHADGVYSGPALDEDAAAAGITIQLTAIRGSQPDLDHIGLDKFHFETGDNNQPTVMICPQAQRIPVELGQAKVAKARYIGRTDSDQCRACPLFANCMALPRRPNAKPTIYFAHETLANVRKRQLILQNRTGPQLRPAVEATVRSVIHPLPHGKAPVRGKFRVSCVMLASAFMVNARRLHGKITQKPLQPSFNGAVLAVLNQISHLLPVWRTWSALHRSRSADFARLPGPGTLRPLPVA